MANTTIAFNKHYVTNGTTKARVNYSLDNRFDGRKCVTLYAKDYSDALANVFGSLYTNNSDSQTDYFEKGKVTLFAGHALYAAARERGEANQQAQISATILAYVKCGEPLEVAFDRVLGAGAYVNFAGSVYDALKGGSLMGAKITARTINAQLAALGIAERLQQGRGYVYFTDGDSSSWYSSSIAVCYVSDLVKPTLAETMLNVLEHRSFLMKGAL